jgi:biopolymer transport protein ExbB
MEILVILKDNFWKFDYIIFVVAIYNFIWCYLRVRKHADKLYYHYNSSDKLSNLPEEKLEKLKKHTKNKKKLSAEDLLDSREKMNRIYALYSNVTTIFPLLGMLGTVWALIPMVNTIGTTDTSNFFSALTSTFWGIIAAIVFKALDSTISYKIDDNEKHTEHLLFKD